MVAFPKKKKLTLWQLMKKKIIGARRWIVGPFRRFRKRYRRSRFLWWAEIWYDVGEIAEDWWEEDSISPTDLEDLFVIQKARYFYDKYTNTYYFSHWSGQEDNYEYHAELTHLRDELEEEYGGFTSQFNIPFYEYYINHTEECDQFRFAFLNEFRIETPWDFVDEDRSELSEDPSLLSVPPFVPADYPQHNHEHKWIHNYHDEDTYVMNKWDQEDGEMFVVGHHTRDEYEWDDEIPFWIDPKLDVLFFDRMRRKWCCHAVAAKKQGVGYNLDLIINYCLKDYYGFLAFDDNINITRQLAMRFKYENNPRMWMPTDVYSQKHLDLILEPLVIEGLLVSYFYKWAAPTHKEVREYMIQRGHVLWVETRKKIFFELGKLSLPVKKFYINFKIWFLKKIFFPAKMQRRRWFTSVPLFFAALATTIGTLISFVLRNFFLMMMYVTHIAWGFLWGTAALLLTIEFFHYCVDEQIITVWMKEYPGEQEIGLQWLYFGILLHFFYIFSFSTRFGNKFISHKNDVLTRKNKAEKLAFSLQNKEYTHSGFAAYWKYRASHSAFETFLYTRFSEKGWIIMGLFLNLTIMVMDDQMAFHWYLEDWMHIQIAVYDWPLINGDVIITDD